MSNLDTRTETSRNLVNQESVQYLRPQKLKLTLIDARPLSKMFVFFGGENVTYRCNLVGNAMGTDLITDSIGQAEIEVDVPPGTFLTGNKEIIVTDADNLTLLETTGSVYGSAKTTFFSKGVVQVFQPIETKITKVKRTVTIQDPLAQSFFTYGVTGGMFLTAIEVYFQTKDTDLPVRCEIREMVNGIPSSIDPGEKNLISVLSPADISTSLDASIPTKFVFNPPIYLQENKDYCFILRSTSLRYNVFTSKLGERSIEDGRSILSQAYSGSVFKSENSITWTAQQDEDVKFTMYKAQFDEGTPTLLKFAVATPPLAAYGDSFTTTSGSNIITYTHGQEHGLEVSSKFHIKTRTDSLYTGAIFNGIPYANFNGTFDVVEVVDRKTFKFQVASNATSTGIISSARILTHVFVNAEGQNYSITDSVTISGGGGSGAAASLTIVGGKIKAVTITNQGSGYTGKPTITINTVTGSGASLQASVTPAMTVLLNKPMTGFIPNINMYNFGTSSTTNSISTTLGNYDGGNLTTYNPGKTIEFINNLPYINIDQHSVVASTYNETSLMAGANSAEVNIEMMTDNPNVSSVMLLSTPPAIEVLSNIINNQPGETLTATASSGTVDTIVVSSVGTGYTVNPIVTISAPDLATGVQATATAARSGTAISTITVTNPGSGYLKTPTVVISRGVGDTTGTGGAAQATLTAFNSELLASGGNAKARYITKRNVLQLVSNGIHLFCVLSSTDASSVDWYVRTSLSTSGLDHDTLEWTRLTCSQIRNKSAFDGDFYEYEFLNDDLPDFDTYDLKAVMTSSNPTRIPVIKSYRVIVVT